MTEAIQPLGRTKFGDAANKGTVLSKEEAMNLLNEWVENDRLRLHMKQVAAVMKAWALQEEQLSEEEGYKWWLAGLLHDADWDKYPNEHCRIIAEELKRYKIAANALWPKTTIATAAVQNLLGGDALIQMSRTPEIVADAAFYILKQSSTECTGNFFH